MKTAAWNVVPLFALLTLAPAGVSAIATPGPQSVAGKTQAGGAATKDAVVNGAEIATIKTKNGLSKAGIVMTDGWITSRVHARLAGEDLLKDSDIRVDTSNHVVTLKGTVMGRVGRARATAVTQRTEGVHRVVNRLTIGPKREH